MATYTNKKMTTNASQLTASAVTQYTVPGSTSAIVKQIVGVNTTSAKHTLTLHLVPSGGSAGVANMFVPAVEIPPNDMVVIDCHQALATGDFIAALADATTSVSLFVSGIEIV